MKAANTLGRLLALLLLIPAALADDVVLVASPFPKEILSAYKKAFDATSPRYRVEFVNFAATRIVPFLRDRAEGSRPDVFWASSPDAFQALRRSGLLETAAASRNPEIPARIGDIPIDDPDGHYLGQALSGYGIMWNARYLAARNLAPPASWDELGAARYFGHVVMSSPARSSTTHLIVESILQGKGWEAGWALILRIAGNAATITERTFDVPNAITRGRFGLGPVVDFVALSGKYSGYPVEFRYPWPGVFTPASIGRIKGARNPEGGEAFIAFALSREAQRLLLRPDISRLSVLPSVYDENILPAGFPKLADLAQSGLSGYDPALSEARYRTVNAIFDQLITFRHRELVRITRALLALDGHQARTPDTEAAGLLAAARARLLQPPIDEADALRLGQRRAPETALDIARAEADWGRRRDDDIAAADDLLRRANDRLGHRQ